MTTIRIYNGALLEAELDHPGHSLSNDADQIGTLIMPTDPRWPVGTVRHIDVVYGGPAGLHRIERAEMVRADGDRATWTGPLVEVVG